MDNGRTAQINSMIEYIVERAFPNSIYNERKAINGREDIILAIAQFREQLKGKSDEEIKQLHIKEKQKELQLRRQEEEHEARRRFFTHPNVKPNYKLYKEKAYLTIKEVASLSLDTEPKNVKWDLMERCKDNRIAKEFMDRKDSIERALKAGELKRVDDWTTHTVQIAPNDFVKWAIEKNLEMPVALVESFKDKLPKIDWEARCKELQQTADDKDARIKSLEAKVRLLSKPLNPKREATYQKLVYACAVLPTKFDVEAERNTSTAILKGKVEAAGLAIDKEALLAVLRDSNEYCQGQIK